jgi:hypothetical protein
LGPKGGRSPGSPETDEVGEVAERGEGGWLTETKIRITIQKLQACFAFARLRRFQDRPDDPSHEDAPD